MIFRKTTVWPIAGLLIANFASALHLHSFSAWVMYGFLFPSPQEQRIEAVVSPIMYMTHFPAAECFGSLPDLFVIICSLMTGFLLGLFTSNALLLPLMPRLSSGPRIIATIILLIDLALVPVLLNDPQKSFSYFLLCLVYALPITVVTGIVLWFRHKRSTQNAN